MDTALVLGIAGTWAGLAAAHSWIGSRYVLPRILANTAFSSMFFVPATPVVRSAVRLAWHVSSVGMICFGAVALSLPWLRSPRPHLWLVAPMILMMPSPMIVGSYIGSALRSRLPYHGVGFTILLWVLLALVVTAAWHAAS